MPGGKAPPVKPAMVACGTTVIGLSAPFVAVKPTAPIGPEAVCVEVGG